MPTPPLSTRERQSWVRTLGWAAYLACSWTWCIGMFLPVLLVRDFGVWGFVVFAVPNVIGAAGMGWVLRSGESARRIEREHGEIVRAFGLVTIAFQWFFVAWLFAGNLGNGIALMAPLPLLAVIGVSMLVPRRLDADRVLTGVMLGASVAIMGALGAAGELALPEMGSADASVLFLAPVCAFGFLLCPYLDGTFLRARESQPDVAAAVSFTVGFGVLFAAMIGFTLLYAGRFGGVDAPTSLGGAERWVGALIAGHILGQALVTASVHRSLRSAAVGSGVVRRMFLPSISLVLVAAVLLATKDVRYAGLSLGEIVYRLFMAFYGLVFPAYVWLCVIPARGEGVTRRPGAGKLRVLGTAVVLAAPCYWMGFVERETWWLGPGLFIVLAARVFVRRGPALSSV